MSESLIENPVNNRGITALIVKGYKAIADEINLEIAPLTIFAGANSSGKSSVMQPLLLMKQTLQATYDPGALLLNGPHVKFTSAKQLFNKNSNGQVNEFDVGIEIHNSAKLICTFIQIDGKAIDLHRIKISNPELIEITNGEKVLDDEQDPRQIINKIRQITYFSKNTPEQELLLIQHIEGGFVDLIFIRKRCFLEGHFRMQDKNKIVKVESISNEINT